MSRQKIELLAPAGSFDCIQAAINGGADAIYFGVDQLNMRTRSSGGFTIDDIKTVCSLTHTHGLRCYLTLNTVMYDHDLRLLQIILREAKAQQVDAIIAADVAVMQYCQEMDIPLHISTQANVTNLAAVQFYARMADVIVLARELTLQQIASITREIRRKDIRGVSGKPLQIEVFAHGALCMAVSGKCYLSLHSQNASANRGACVQNCRRPYRVSDAETGEEWVVDNEYIMSPKDLCTLPVLDQLLQSGVNVLKIEGRSKGADYVQVVTGCYREAIDALHEGTFTAERISEWMTRLGTVFNRGFWEGYYLGHHMGEWTKQPGSAAAEKKIYVGKGSKYYNRIGIGEFDIEAGTLSKGDELMILGNGHGMLRLKAEPLVVNGKEADEAGKGDKITFPVANKVVPGDKLFKIVPNA